MANSKPLATMYISMLNPFSTLCKWCGMENDHGYLQPLLHLLGIHLADPSLYLSNRAHSFNDTVPKKYACCITNTQDIPQSNTIVFTIISTIRRDKYNLPRNIIGQCALFGYIIYFTGDAPYYQETYAIINYA